MFAQLGQRTSHARAPPPRTTRPRALRPAAPQLHRTRGDPRAAVVAARAPAGDHPLCCPLGQSVARVKGCGTRARQATREPLETPARADPPQHEAWRQRSAKMTVSGAWTPIAPRAVAPTQRSRAAGVWLAFLKSCLQRVGSACASTEQVRFNCQKKDRTPKVWGDESTECAAARLGFAERIQFPKKYEVTCQQKVYRRPPISIFCGARNQKSPR
jgi:hypothetical protein